jgi:Spy/CpxP family protein refolding chaperone
MAVNKVRLIILVGFALAFAAGASVGMLAASGGRRRPSQRPGAGRQLAKELGLTTEQQAQMRKIWSEAMGGQARQQWRDRRTALYRQRTEAIEALLTDEQQARYEEILAEHAREMEKINQERNRLVQEAVERTKKILTQEQAKKYEEIRKSRHRGGGPGRGAERRFGGPPGVGRRGEHLRNGRHRPASQPGNVLGQEQ